MMDDFYKLFGGLGSYEKLIAQSKSMSKIEALTNPLHMSNFIKERDENLILKAIAGNSLQLWEVLNKPPKTPDYIGMPIMKAISHSINNFPKANPTFNLSSLASPMVTLQQQWMERNNQNSTMLNAVMGNTASMLVVFNNRPKIPDSIINVFGMNWYNYANQSNKVGYTINELSMPLINLIGISQKRKFFKSSEFSQEKENLNKSKDRFVANISKVMSEIVEIEENDIINIQTQFDEALKQEIAIAVTTPISLYTFEFILNNYNEIIENFIKVGEISNDVIKSFLQTTDVNSLNFSAMNWILIVVFTSCLGTFTYDKIKRANQKHSLTNISINAITNNSKTILSKPHGNGKFICDIPESTFIIIGACKGKYIEVRVLLNGKTYLGWTINEGISER